MFLFILRTRIKRHTFFGRNAEISAIERFGGNDRTLSPVRFTMEGKKIIISKK